MDQTNMFERYDELRRKEEVYEAIVTKFGSLENVFKARNEEDILKFYYCESEDKYLVGQRADTFYYAEVGKTGLCYIMSRYLPWGKHVVAPHTLWKEHTYPSEPKEIDFFDWLQGYIKQIDKTETKDIKTNADRIRNMTDEELAEFWEHGCDEVIDCKVCEEPRNEYGSCTGQCRKEFLRWLQKEVE